jgi:hypothetical protein
MINKLSSLLNIAKKEEKEYYLSLILRNEKVKAVIFEKENDKLKLVSSNEENFSSTIEDASLEEFITVLDKAVSGAEVSFSTSVDKYKTILALKDNWIEGEKIKKDYLDKLKKAGDELGLDPIGFLTFSESITNYLQQEEGAPITAILSEVGNKYLTVYYIKSGRVMEAKTSEIHQGAAFTVDTLLKHLETPAVMPTRIIILNSEEDELTQEFINHQWSRSLNFLHIPQVLMLPANSDIKAVLLGAATQMGATLEYTLEEKLPEPDENPVERQEETQKKDVEEPAGEQLDYVGRESMGFFGFSNADVAKSAPPSITPKTEVKREDLEEVSNEIPEDVKMRMEKKFNIGTLGVLATDLAKVSFIKIRRLLSKEGLSSLREGGLKDRRKLLIAAAVVLGLLLFYFLFVFQTTAKVDLTVKSESLSRDESLVFSPTSTTDLEGGVLEATIVTIEKEGSVTIDVKGKKDVGEEAKGTVTIFNNDTDPVSLAKGTVITASNDLEFVLDNAVSVASASGDVFSGTKPGTTNVNVTAGEIGTEYNLPSDTKFTIGTNKAIGAKNDKAFSGGSKKNVFVVSKDDFARARAELPKKLAEQAQDELSEKVEKGKTILPQFIDTELLSEKFDKKEEDEAEKLTLTGTVAFNYIAYTDSDMISFAQNLFSDSDVEIMRSSIKTDVKELTVARNRDVSTDLAIEVKVLPKIDSVKLANEIKGLSVQEAKSLLENLDNAEKVDVFISPPIPFLSSSLPKNPNNITLNVISN